VGNISFVFGPAKRHSKLKGVVFITVSTTKGEITAGSAGLSTQTPFKETIKMNIEIITENESLIECKADEKGINDLICAEINFASAINRQPRTIRNLETNKGFIWDTQTRYYKNI
jgi:hypothetical protein